MGRLEGKVTIVTGGARGIGRAIVDKAVREGARVSLFDLDGAASEEAVAALADANLRAAFYAVDVTVESQIREAIDAVIARDGPIDVLVNNAGRNAYFDPV